jgi:sugar phosphate isomerase/epimerase
MALTPPEDQEMGQDQSSRRAPLTRRDVLRVGAVGGAWVALGLPLVTAGCSFSDKSAAAARASQGRRSLGTFDISLAEWSLHRALQAGELDNLDFPRVAREDYDIGAVEYVNAFFKDKARDRDYLADLKQRCDDHGVRSLLIMVDGEGALADADDNARRVTVGNHVQWLEAAAALGCHSIRVNAGGSGDVSSGGPAEKARRAADSLRWLAELAAPYDLNVIVENHGGDSSNGAWLAGVMKLADHPRVGTLPDFGNFRMSEGKWYDRYRGVEELMPYAKAVSAKSHDFDASGAETQTDYMRMLAIVLGAGYHGYVGIEWEGDSVSEPEGIRLTKALLERVRDELA